MFDKLHDAQEELKRCDHLISVSLKYTRTVDVFLSIVNRFIECTDFVIAALFMKLEEEHKIIEQPQSPVARANGIKKEFADDKIIVKMMNDYLLFRKVIRAKYTKRNEFRRYVTMTAQIDEDNIIEIDIDKIEVFYDDIRNFVRHAAEMLKAR